MEQLVDPRRHLQQTVLAHEIYRNRIHSFCPKDGDEFNDWIAAGKILNLFETDKITFHKNGYKKWICFFMMGYIEYAQQLEQKLEREIQ